MFFEQPPGFKVKDKDGGELVMQLEKSLYGLAQSPGTGSTPSIPHLSRSAFFPLQPDTCVNLYDDDGVRIYLTFYVEDLLLAAFQDDRHGSGVARLEIKRDLVRGTLIICQ